MTDLSSWVADNAARTPAKTAIRFAGEDISYARFMDMICGHARVLKHGHGVGAGDRVAVLGFNSPSMLALFFACARLGAMFAPLNWRLAAPELRYILEDATPRAVIAGAQHQALAAEAAQGVGGTAVVPAEKMAAEAESCPGEDSNPGVGPETPCLLVYSSGTTGRPKGVVLTQDAISANAENCIHYSALSGRDRVLTVLALFHVGGLNILTTPAFRVGAEVVLHERFEAGAVLRAIAQERATLLVLVPATIQAVIDLPGWDAADLSGLRLVTTGSSQVPLHLIEAFHERGVPVCQVYGLTETAPVAACQTPAEALCKPGSAGKCAPQCEMKIVREDGQAARDGVAGEVVIRGRNVLREYWNNAAATRDALRGGWFHTGDIGYRDADGDLYIKDRKTDVVISGGENIYPAELEQFARGMADISDAAVVGRADARWGEVPVAFVVQAPGVSLTAGEFLARFEGRLARFKHPKEVIFVAELPRNALGKVLKPALRAAAGL